MTTPSSSGDDAEGGVRLDSENGDTSSSNDDNANDDGIRRATTTTTTTVDGDALLVERNVELDELVYAVSSFDAIVKPVFLTMVIAALTVIYVNTPESRQEGEEALSDSYTVVKGDEDDSNGQKLGQSLVNGLVIVCAICFMTFMIVLLYKYRCMKVILGYMIIAMTTLLGIESSLMFQIVIERYHLRIDRISFALTIYNFAIVGTAAIFFGQGFPTYVTQGYLMAVSIIVAWQLSHFDPWTAWGLLVMLALYDLFAVLSPCGPLKALITLMQKRDAPQLPGLLYEASFMPNNDTNHTAQSSQNGSSNRRPQQTENIQVLRNLAPPAPPQQRNTTTDHEAVRLGNDVARDETGPSTQLNVLPTTESVASETIPEHADLAQQSPRPSSGMVPLGLVLFNRLKLLRPDEVLGAERRGRNIHTYALDSWSAQELRREVEVHFSPNGIYIERHTPQRQDEETRYAVYGSNGTMERILFVNRDGLVMEELRNVDRRTGRVPLAIARVSKLPLVHDPEPSWMRRTSASDDVEDSGSETFSALQLQQEVEVVFPPNGCYITRHSEQRQGEETRYAVIRADGSIKRVLYVNSEGRVFEDLRHRNTGADEEPKERNSIKLGLGDFIFYSILVSKAALYSFTAFSACSIAVIIGLGMTLGFLAIHGKALPALPISIFLGVLFYLITRYLVQPWMEEILVQHIYV